MVQNVIRPQPGSNLFINHFSINIKSLWDLSNSFQLKKIKWPIPIPKYTFKLFFRFKIGKALIHASWEDELYKYITGIIQNKGQKLIAINGMPDHIHIFIGMKPNCNLSDLVREVKKSSNSFINEKQFTAIPFYWQEGFGAFSYSFSHIDKVIQYIRNQKIHHQKKSFKEEYLEFLEKFEIEYKDEYLFEWLD